MNLGKALVGQGGVYVSMLSAGFVGQNNRCFENLLLKCMGAGELSGKPLPSTRAEGF